MKLKIIFYSYFKGDPAAIRDGIFLFSPSAPVLERGCYEKLPFSLAVIAHVLRLHIHYDTSFQRTGLRWLLFF